MSDELFELCMNLGLQNIGLLVTVNLKVDPPIPFLKNVGTNLFVLSR